MTLKELINAAGGPSHCAKIWGISPVSVSHIFTRNSISLELLQEIREHQLGQADIINAIINGKMDIDFSLTTRKSARRKKVSDD